MAANDNQELGALIDDRTAEQKYADIIAMLNSYKAKYQADLDKAAASFWPSFKTYDNERAGKIDSLVSLINSSASYCAKVEERFVAEFYAAKMQDSTHFLPLLVVCFNQYLVTHGVGYSHVDQKPNYADIQNQRERQYFFDALRYYHPGGQLTVKTVEKAFAETVRQSNAHAAQQASAGVTGPPGGPPRAFGKGWR